jgi:hypothetical protein
MSNHWLQPQHGLKNQDFGLSVTDQVIVGTHATTQHCQRTVWFHAAGEFLPRPSIKHFELDAVLIKPSGQIAWRLGSLMLKN